MITQLECQFIEETDSNFRGEENEVQAASRERSNEAGSAIGPGRVKATNHELHGSSRPHIGR